MNELVFKSSKGNPITTSLIVAELFEKNHRDVLESIKNLVAENSAAKFFAFSSYENRGKKYPMYLMTRDGFSLLVMGFTGERALKFKITFIEAFNAMEQKLKQPIYVIPQTYAEALELAAHQAREIEVKDKLIAIQSPKADFADRVIDTDNMVDIGQAAKLLKLPYGRNTFFDVLQNNGIFFKGRNEPMQQYVNSGYFQLRAKEITRKDHPSFSVLKILVTQKGLFWLSKKFGGTYNDSFPTLNAQ